MQSRCSKSRPPTLPAALTLALLQEYAAYLKDLHDTYPDYYAKPLTFGYVDNRSMFVSFEGQVSVKTPKFL